MRALAANTFLTLVSFSVSAVEVSPYPTPAQTRAEFDRLCGEITASANRYYGTAQIDRLRSELDDPATSATDRTRLRDLLAYHLIRLGRFEEAAVEAREALDALPGGSSDRIRAHLLERLAMAHFQEGEEENCLARHTAASCILPLAPTALHTIVEPVRTAARHFRAALELEPGDVERRWLLVLSSMLADDYPSGVPESLRLPEDALGGDPSPNRWSDVAGALGLAAFDLAGGAVIDDFDGDGFLDLVSSSSNPCAPMKAYRNRGDGTFEDVSGRWGLDAQLGGLNLEHADFDGDGSLDLLVLRGGWLGEDGRMRNSLLRNDLAGEKGRFVDVTAAAGLAYPAYPTQTGGWADYDGDGDLDLYVGNESQTISVDPLELYRTSEGAYPSQLFRNDGDGTFTDVARSAGVTNGRFAKGVAWGDYDDDEDPDLYVSNIGPNRLYRNDGNGTFTDVATGAGVVEPSRGSFATWFFDHDNDGDLDLFVAHYQTPIANVLAGYLGLPTEPGHPVLYENRGDGTFADVSARTGLERPLLPMGANYGDIDHDGRLDIALGTGTPDFTAIMPNVLYRNEGGRFRDVTFETGFGNLQKGHGIAFGDLDHDGDQDIFQQLGGALPYDEYVNALYENPGGGGNWVTLVLEGRRANRSGVGARIAVHARNGDRERTIHVLAGNGGSFGGSTLRQEIGIGTADRVERIVVEWPGSGTRDVWREIEPNRAYRAVEGAAELEPLELPRLELTPTMEGDADTPSEPGHRHEEDR